MILKIINKDYKYVDRSIDPRVQFVALYVNLNNNELKNLSKAFPEVNIKYSIFLKPKSFTIHKLTPSKKFSLTGTYIIYNVSPKKRDELIKLHDEEQKKKLEEIKESNIKF